MGASQERTLFEREGTLVDAGSDQSFLLDETFAWRVASGRIDVFVVGYDPERDDIVGARRHLFRVEAGGPLIGMGAPPLSEGLALLAVGSTGTTLRRVRLSALQYALGEPGRAAEVIGLLEAWIGSLCAAGGDLLPKRCAEIETGVTTTLKAGATVRPRDDVAWLRHVEGSSHFLGEPGLKVNGEGFFPVSNRAWIEIAEPAALQLVPTTDLVDSNAVFDGLARLLRLVLTHANRSAQREDLAERDRLVRKLAGDRATLSEAFANIGALLGTDARVPAPAAGATTADSPRADEPTSLLAACRLVGGVCNLAIRDSGHIRPGARPRDQLASIARASRFRLREVALRGRWWEADNGPLLGMLEEGKHFVALIPVDDRRYRLLDPGTCGDQFVTEEVAATLSPFAYTFYRPFPDHPLSIADILRFGLQGTSRDFVAVAGMGAAAGLLGLVTPLATGMIYNSIIPGAERGQLVQLALILIVCALATTLFSVTRTVAFLRIEARMGTRVQAAVWDRLLSLPLPFFRPYSAGELAARAMGVDEIRQIISGATTTALLGGIFSVFSFGLLFYYSVRLAWWGTLVIGVAIAVSAVASYLQLRSQRGIAALRSRTAGMVLQFLGSIGKLRVAGAEAHAFAIWSRLFSEQRTLQFRVRSIGNVLAAFSAALPVLAYVVLFAVIVTPVEGAAPLRTGDFLAFMSAFATCLMATTATTGAIVSALAAVPIYENARPILVTPPEVDDGKIDPGELTGEVDVQRVTFRYAPDSPPVLRDLSFHIKPGEFVAFVGPSGSGKSTILRLLLGFEQPETGTISYDGHNLSGADTQAVRRQMGVVLQSGRLMAGDILTNIVGASMASLNDAMEAARMAGLDEDIRHMAMGMHTVVSEGGGTLSGGQRQRLLIARAIVTRPRILLFDEATSALDNRTQSIVSASLEQLKATRIVIAHRLSTIVNADRIILVRAGRIEQSGRYEELINQEGLFAELARRQIS
jgi:NHLM bacteriocin system ABC transporter ATP-binding protein